jgi:hypothetical protein
MVQGFNYLDFFRSLSFGGLVGGGIAGIVYLRYPHLFKDIAGLKSFMLYGALAGASTQRTIEAAINLILFPLGRFIAFYESLVELEFLRFLGKVSEEQYKSIGEKLTEERFLGKSSDKLLPPSS